MQLLRSKWHRKKFAKNWKIKYGEHVYKELIHQYYKIYLEESSGGKVYGKSSEDLLLKIAPLVNEINPKKILDFGCGRSSLISYFWNNGERELFKYDPAIREYREVVKDPMDLVICTDVMEHIPEDFLFLVLDQIQEVSNNAIFTISLKSARKKLPSGVNAHITIRPVEFWIQIIYMVFGKVTVLEQDENGVFIKTW